MEREPQPWADRVSAPALQPLRCAFSLGIGTRGWVFPLQVFSTWPESLHHRGDTRHAPDFTAQARVPGVSARKENVGRNSRWFARAVLGTLAVPGRTPAGLAMPCVSDLGADPAVGQLAAGACPLGPDVAAGRRGSGARGERERQPGGRGLTWRRPRGSEGSPGHCTAPCSGQRAPGPNPSPPRGRLRLPE